MMQQTASIRHTLRVRLRSAIKSIRAVTSPWGPRLLSFLIRSVSGQMLSLTVLIFRQDCIDSSLARLKLEGLQLVESNLQKWTSKRKETPKMQLVLERMGKMQNLTAGTICSPLPPHLGIQDSGGISWYMCTLSQFMPRPLRA